MSIFKSRLWIYFPLGAYGSAKLGLKTPKWLAKFACLRPRKRPRKTKNDNGQEKRNITRSRPRKLTRKKQKNFLWSFSWSRACFLSIVSYFLVFFYKFPPAMFCWSIEYFLGWRWGGEWRDQYNSRYKLLLPTNKSSIWENMLQVWTSMWRDLVRLGGVRKEVGHNLRISLNR